MQKPFQNYFKNFSSLNNQNENILYQKRKSPYEYGFEEEEQYKKYQQQKYKEELDFLINFRKKKQTPINNENELKREYQKNKEIDDVIKFYI